MLKIYILNILAVLSVGMAFGQINLLPAGDFESGNLSPFVAKNQGAGIEITQESTNGGDYAVKLTAGNASADAWSLQFATPVLPVVEGNSYQVSFDIRSSGAGQGRISLGAQSFTYQYWPDFTTTEEWQTITYTQIYGGDLVALLTELEINFDLGYIMDMTYYIDNIQVIDLDAQPAVEYISNGTFETGIDGWSKYNGGDDALSHAAGSAYAVKLTAGSASTDAWSLQLATPTLTLTEGNSYEVSFDVRSTGTGQGRISLGAASFTYQYWPDFATTEEWQTFTYSAIYGENLVALLTELEVNFDMGYIADMTYYIDNVIVTDVTAGSVLLNGDFEDGSLGSFVVKNPGAGTELTQESTSGGSFGYESAGAMKVINETGTPGEQWNTQIHTDFDPILTSGVNYKISYYIRSEEAGSVRCSSTGETAHYQADVATTSDWQLVNWEIIGNGTETGFNFDLGGVAGVYYIDNVTVTAMETTLSSDATLSDLTIDGSTVTGFSSATLSYNIELPVGTSTVPTVEATTTHGAASVVVNAATSLPGTTEVLVTAENDATSTYSINFTVALSDDATLSDLTIDGSTVSGFSSATLTYNIELPAGTTTVPTVEATTSYGMASAVVTAATSLPGITEVLVTAEDGTTSEYSINFTVQVILNTDRRTTEIKVYPNPTVNVINLSNLKEPSLLMLLDISGREIMRMSSTSSQYQIDVSNLKVGIYYLMINQDQQLKFIKK